MVELGINKGSGFVIDRTDACDCLKANVLGFGISCCGSGRNVARDPFFSKADTELKRLRTGTGIH